MLAGIVAFELRVTRLQTKIKVNQHRPEAHARMREIYAAGNDMASIMGGNYPGAGITLGPALTFGYIAGRHLANSATRG